MNNFMQGAGRRVSQGFNGIASNPIARVGAGGLATAGLIYGVDQFNRARQRDNTDPVGALGYDYDSAQQYDRQALTGSEMADQINRQARGDVQFHQGLAQDQAMFNRGIGRDLLQQESDNARAIQGQKLRSDEAKNLLSNYTQRLMGNQNFIGSLMSGVRYS